MVARDAHRRQVNALLRRFPVVAIVGARQVGKTTLAAEIAASAAVRSARFDLESPADLARLADPMLALAGLDGIVVLDGSSAGRSSSPCCACCRIGGRSRRAF